MYYVSQMIIHELKVLGVDTTVVALSSLLLAVIPSEGEGELREPYNKRVVLLRIVYYIKIITCSKYLA